MRGLISENKNKGPIINKTNSTATQCPLTNLLKSVYSLPVLFCIILLLEIAEI